MPRKSTSFKVYFLKQGYDIHTHTITGYTAVPLFPGMTVSGIIVINLLPGLVCLPGEPLLVSSSQDNTLKMWIFDMADGGGRLLR